MCIPYPNKITKKRDKTITTCVLMFLFLINDIFAYTDFFLLTCLQLDSVVYIHIVWNLKPALLTITFWKNICCHITVYNCEQRSQYWCSMTIFGHRILFVRKKIVSPVKKLNYATVDCGKNYAMQCYCKLWNHFAQPTSQQLFPWAVIM